MEPWSLDRWCGRGSRTPPLRLGRSYSLSSQTLKKRVKVPGFLDRERERRTGDETSSPSGETQDYIRT